MRKKKPKNIDTIISHRFTILLSLMILFFVIITIKMTNIMLFEEDTYEASLNHLTYTQVTGTSTPRGRIYDRNYNIIVDNKSLKTITYQKSKNTTSEEMIQVANSLSPHIELNTSRITDRNKREYYCAKNQEVCKVTFKVKTGASDKVFGSVSSKSIVEELKKKGFNIDKKNVMIKEPISSLGTHNVDIELHKKVIAQVKVVLNKE